MLNIIDAWACKLVSLKIFSCCWKEQPLLLVHVIGIPQMVWRIDVATLGFKLSAFNSEPFYDWWKETRSNVKQVTAEYGDGVIQSQEQHVCV